MAGLSSEELLEAIGKLSSEELRDVVSAIEDDLLASGSEVAAEPPIDYTAGFWRYEDGYKVVLVDCGPNKVQVVKLLRRHFDLVLKEAMDMAKNPPQTIGEHCAREEAYDLKGEFESVGAVVALEPDFYRVYDPWNISPGYAYD